MKSTVPCIPADQRDAYLAHLFPYVFEEQSGNAPLRVTKV